MMIIIPSNKILLIPMQNHEQYLQGIVNVIMAVTQVHWFRCTFCVIFRKYVTRIFV
uniref:Uncharacterized protein n=1 Tax=Setaria italica TaxID=4555 RepID=K3ZG17_SETIT